MNRPYFDDGLRTFHRCPDCQTTIGQHAHGCPSDPLASEYTPEEADRLRAEHEAQERAKVERKAAEREQWHAAIARARAAQDAAAAEELAADVAWARTVLVPGETFPSGTALYCALHQARKASDGRSLSYSTIARLRRVVVALTPDLVAEPTRISA